MNTLAILRNVPLFTQLDDSQLQRLDSALGVRRFKRGETIFHQGSDGDELYLIVDGQVRIYTISQLGQEISVKIFRDGDFFGELSLLDGLPRSAGAEAMSRTTTLTLKRATFLRIIRDDPEIAVRVLSQLSARLRSSNIYIEYLASHSAPQRVVRSLLDMAEQHSTECSDHDRIDLLLTQDDLASLAGTTRETVNRVLSSLRERGLISVDRGRVRVLNLPQLERSLS
ncbi:MAG: Crp/Fnr family transcriptional regulator [Oscillochloris sp.]|nr:Crp/Fnr family transcriptional regulator [Oscillochloris sp.]